MADDLDELMNELGVRSHDRPAMREALIDAYEPAKAKTDWVLDAALIALTREGKLPPPEPGSPLATLLARSVKVS
jgi:hypothetical protein